jgi:hypothetical protein
MAATGQRAVVAERLTGGQYIDVEIDRTDVSRYGLSTRRTVPCAAAQDLPCRGFKSGGLDMRGNAAANPAIVAQAVWGMVRTLCPDLERASIGAHGGADHSAQEPKLAHSWLVG